MPKSSKRGVASPVSESGASHASSQQPSRSQRGRSPLRDASPGGKSSARTPDADVGHRTADNGYDAGAATLAVHEDEDVEEGKERRQQVRPGEGIYARRQARAYKFSLLRPLAWMSPKARDTFWFSAFIVLFSIGCFSGRPSASSFFMAKTFSSKVMAIKTPADDTWSTLRDVESLWEWLEGPLFELLYLDNTPRSKEGTLQSYNYIINGCRIRQIRVLPEECRVIPSWAEEPFSLSGDTCYGPLRASIWSSVASGNNMDTSPYGGKREDGTDVFVWSEAAPWSVWSSTSIAAYPPSGYHMDLPAFNVSKALDVFNFYRRNEWLDVQTRAVFVELMTYNPNLNELTSMRLLAETSEFGGVVTSSEFRPVRIYRYEGSWGTLQLVFEALFLLVLLKFVLEEVGQMMYMRALYLTRSEGHFVWLVFALVVSIAMLRINAILTVNSQTFIGEAQRTSSSTAVHYSYTDLSNLPDVTSVEENVLAALAVCIYGRLFLYLAENPILQHIVHMLQSALFEIVPFVLLFVVVFLGFAQAFYFVFGTRVYEYRDFPSTLLTNLRLILGSPSAPYDDLTQANWVMAPLLYYSLLVTEFFLLLNVFIAIIVHSYAMYKNEIDQDPTGQIKEIVSKAFEWFFHKMVGRGQNRVGATQQDHPGDSKGNAVERADDGGGEIAEGRERAIDGRERKSDEGNHHDAASKQNAGSAEGFHMAEDVLRYLAPPAPVMHHGDIGASVQIEDKLSELIKRSDAVESLRTELLSVSDRLNALTEYILAEPTSKIQKQVELVSRKLDLLAEALIASQSAEKGNPQGGEEGKVPDIPGWT